MHRPRPHALLLTVALALSGCPDPQPVRKGSTAPGARSNGGGSFAPPKASTLTPAATRTPKSSVAPGVQLGLTDPDDHGDTLATASALRVGDSVSGCLEVTGDADCFVVELVANRRYVFGLHGFGAAHLRLLAPDGKTELASAGRGQILAYRAASGGRHYLRVGEATSPSQHYAVEALLEP